MLTLRALIFDLALTAPFHQLRTFAARRIFADGICGLTLQTLIFGCAPIAAFHGVETANALVVLDIVSVKAFRAFLGVGAGSAVIDIFAARLTDLIDDGIPLKTAETF